MRLIFLDNEAYYSKTHSLRKMTIPEYILSPEWETIGWACIDGVNGKPFWLEGDEVANWLGSINLDDVGICCHNTPYDGSILSLRYDLHPAFYFDTMAMSRAQLAHLTNGRVSLDTIAKHYGLPEKGKAIHKVEGLHLQEIKDAGFYDEYVAYSCHDVHLCREIFKRLMPDFPNGELKIIDELVNMVTQPMFAINRGLLVEHLTKIRERKAALLARINLSKLELMSNDKFAAALESLGVVAPRKISPTTGVETWALAKTDKEFQALAEHPSEDVQALVAARLGHKSTLEETRTERFIAIHDATQAGLGYPAMPVPLRYSGAHTHRFSGDWSLNLQNLPSRGNTTLRDALVAPDGYVVVTCDSSQVEARLTAWLSGQGSLVEQFDKGEDVYSSFASKVYGYTVTKKNKTERFLGKTCILGLGFGMGHVKFRETIRVQAAAMGIDLPMNEDDAKRIVWLYRNTYDRINQTWRGLSDLLFDMADGRSDGRTFGPCTIEGTSILLPTGLRIQYPDLRREGTDLIYGLGRRIYGGKCLENIVQALDRVVVIDASQRVKARTGYRMTHQMHDELVYVVPENYAEEMKAVLLEEMCRRPVWGPDLPLDAEAGVGKTFGACK